MRSSPRSPPPPPPPHLEDLQVAAGDVLPGVVLPGDAEFAAGRVCPAQPLVAPAADGAHQPGPEPQLLGLPASAGPSPGAAGTGTRHTRGRRPGEGRGGPRRGWGGWGGCLPLALQRCHGAARSRRARAGAGGGSPPGPFIRPRHPLPLSWKPRDTSENESVAGGRPPPRRGVGGGVSHAPVPGDAPAGAEEGDALAPAWCTLPPGGGNAGRGALRTPLPKLTLINNNRGFHLALHRRGTQTSVGNGQDQAPPSGAGAQNACDPTLALLPVGCCGPQKCWCGTAAPRN